MAPFQSAILHYTRLSLVNRKPDPWLACRVVGTGLRRVGLRVPRLLRCNKKSHKSPLIASRLVGSHPLMDHFPTVATNGWILTMGMIVCVCGVFRLILSSILSLPTVKAHFPALRLPAWRMTTRYILVIVYFILSYFIIFIYLFIYYYYYYFIFFASFSIHTFLILFVSANHTPSRFAFKPFQPTLPM